MSTPKFDRTGSSHIDNAVKVEPTARSRKSILITIALCSTLPMLGGCAAAGLVAALSQNNPRASTSTVLTGAANLVATPVPLTSSINWAGSDGLILVTVDNSGELVIDVDDPISRPIITSISVQGDGSISGISYTSSFGTTVFTSDDITIEGSSIKGEKDDVIFGVIRQDYSHFGIWVQDWGYNSAYLAGSYSGDRSSTSLPASGTANYSGAFSGYYINRSGSLLGTYGPASAAVNFTTRTGTFSAPTVSLTSGASSSNLGFNGSFGISDSTFSGAVSNNQGDSGFIFGEFFGPSAAEMAGLFSMEGSGIEIHAGSFGLRKQ